MTDMIDKITALRAKIPENGATEDEAMAALAIAAKLMEKHGITEADLKAVEFGRDMRQGEFTQRQKAVHPSQKYCAMTIGLFCGVKAWTSYVGPRKKHLKMFGLINDVEMAEFLLGLIHDSMNRGWKEFLRDNPKDTRSRHTQYWSFMMGFADRVNEKLEELMRGREAQVDSTGNDLVVVKMALVEEGLSSMLPDLKLKKGKSSSTSLNIFAYSQGQTAGNKVNLNRPIQSKSNVKRIT